MEKLALALTAFLLSGALAAAPAAWHMWRSKSTGLTVCVQVSPGEGWERVDGPYRDAQCEKHGQPGR